MIVLNTALGIYLFFVMFMNPNMKMFKIVFLLQLRDATKKKQTAVDVQWFLLGQSFLLQYHNIKVLFLAHLYYLLAY